MTGRPPARGVIRRLAAVLGLTTVVALITVVGSTPGEAGTDGPPPLTLLEQTTWVAPEGTFTITVDPGTTAIDPDGTIQVRLRDAVANRDEFTVGLGEAGPGPIEAELVLPTTLARQTDGTLTVTLPTGPDGPLPISEPGVYPLDLTVGLDGGSTAGLLTHLVRLPVADPRPDLRVALIVPVGTDPLVQPDGALSADPTDVERVEHRVAPLVAEPDVPLTVVPVPETMGSFAATPQGGAIVNDLAGALDGRQVLGAPYVELDEAAWVDSGLDESLDDQVAAGAAAVVQTLAVLPDDATRYLAQPPTSSALPSLGADGVTHLVVPAETIAAEARPPDGSPWLGPVVLTTPSTNLPAAVTDTELQAHVGRTGDPVLDAHRTLADLATIALGRPLTPAGMVLALPDQDLVIGDYLLTLLDDIDGGPLAPVTVSDWFSDIEASTVRGVAPRPSGGLEEYRDNLALIELTIGGLASLTDGEDPTLDDLERQSLVSGSIALTPAEQSAYFSAIGATIRLQTQLIDTPPDTTVTLTSRSGRIPVSIRSRMEVPARVRLQVSSDRLEFPEGSVIDVDLVDEITTVEIPIQARTTGSFQMAVAVTSPDGILAVTATKVTIRSTAVSSVGVVLSIGAGLVLLTWWLRHWREHRRDARLMPPPS